MARGPRLQELKLTDTERERLLEWTRRHKSAQALAMRARIVLAAAEGHRNGAVADQLRITAQTVGKWRSRFARLRLDGLLDEPRPGAPRQIGDEQVEALIAKTLHERPEGATHWSSRLMAEASGLSQTAVVRIWHAFGLQPHRTETFKLSTDPLFIEKVRDIVGLYLNPPTKALVMDNYGTHKTHTVRRWLPRHPRFHVHFTPTSAS
jgi:transposase